MSFAGRTVLITGAASGIGLATAHHLSSAGARLILCDLAADSLADAFPDARLATGDVADESLWDRLVPDIAAIDHAVVNAGVAWSGAIADLEFCDWRRVLAVNLDGAFLTLRAAMRAMKAHGRGGSIVLTASAAGIKAEPGIAAYGASKAAVLHLARIAAKEGAPDRIRVNAVAPGGVETPIWRGVAFFDDLVARTGSEAAGFAEMGRMATPLGRYAQAGEIAAQIAFLLSDACGVVTGATLVADGGYTL